MNEEYVCLHPFMTNMCYLLLMFILVSQTQWRTHAHTLTEESHNVGVVKLGHERRLSLEVVLHVGRGLLLQHLHGHHRERLHRQQPRSSATNTFTHEQRQQIARGAPGIRITVPREAPAGLFCRNMFTGFRFGCSWVKLVCKRPSQWANTHSTRTSCAGSPEGKLKLTCCFSLHIYI